MEEQTNHRNSIESPEVMSHKYNWLIFDKGVEAVQWRRAVFSTNGAAATGHSRTKT